MADTPGQSSVPTIVQHINPAGMHKNPAFSQAIVVSGPAKTIYIGGQNAVSSAGEIVGRGDIRAQTEQVFANLQTVLAEAGAGLEHIVKWTLYIVQGQPLQPGFEVFQRTWGRRPNPPTISAMYVAGLANPEFLIELDAVAVVPLEP